MDIKIRLATQEDDERIIEVQTLSLLSTSKECYNETQIESLVRGQKKARIDYSNLEFVIVAEYENQIVGCGFCYFYSPEITGLYVHPDFKNRGIGTLIENQLENILIQLKYQYIEVLSSLEAVKFYKKLGFEFVRESGFLSEYKNWIPTTLLRKNLSQTCSEELELSLLKPIEVCCQLTLDDCLEAQNLSLFHHPIYEKLILFWNWLGLFALGLFLFDKIVMPGLIMIFIFLCFKFYISVVNRWFIQNRPETQNIINQEFKVKFSSTAIEFEYQDNQRETIPITDFSQFFCNKKIIILGHASKSYIIPNRYFTFKKDMLIVLFQLNNNMGNCQQIEVLRILNSLKNVKQ